MDKAFHHNQPMKERTACAQIKRAATHMERSERLAIVLMLVSYCFKESDKLTGLVDVELVVTGSKSFNETVEDIKLFFPQLPTRSLAELAVAILLPELTFIPTVNPR
jgi:hypothetical protein